jgi:hypothetical protein
VKKYVVSNVSNTNLYNDNYVVNIYNHIVHSAVINYVPRIIVKISTFSAWQWVLSQIGLNHWFYMALVLCCL